MAGEQLLFHRPGRVFPRSVLREGWPEQPARARRRRANTAALLPAAAPPPPPVIIGRGGGGSKRRRGRALRSPANPYRLHGDRQDANRAAFLRRRHAFLFSPLSYGGTMRGAASVLNAYVFTEALRGRYRVANDARERYELFRGTDAAPDLTGSAYATFTSAPYITGAQTPPVSGERTYRFVLRRRNRYNLSSQNDGEWSLTIDSTGAIVATRPSAPVDLAISAAAAGKVLVTARYLYLGDLSADRADRWLVYLKVGSAPVPGVDTPAVVTMGKADGVARLSYTSSAYTNGQVVYAVVRTRRAGSPNVDSSNTDSVNVTVDTTGPAAPTRGGAFFGSTTEQE